MVSEDGAAASLHYDQLGSLRVVAGSSGNVVKEIVYDPFGMVMEDTNPSFRIPIGFSGGLYDEDLNLRFLPTGGYSFLLRSIWSMNRKIFI